MTREEIENALRKVRNYVGEDVILTASNHEQIILTLLSRIEALEKQNEFTNGALKALKENFIGMLHLVQHHDRQIAYLMNHKRRTEAEAENLAELDKIDWSNSF